MITALLDDIAWGREIVAAFADFLMRAPSRDWSDNLSAGQFLKRAKVGGRGAAVPPLQLHCGTRLHVNTGLDLIYAPGFRLIFVGTKRFILV
jgi:hypothetical protein